jgi:CDP-diacylglycerol pyrophosphatase
LPNSLKKTRNRRLARWSIVGALTLSLALAAYPVALLAATRLEHSLGRDDLWRVIAFVCVPASRIGIPFPCADVHVDPDGDFGWAVLPVAANHILTVPTKRIEGIESPAAQTPYSARYWQAAWDARQRLEVSHGQALPRQRYGLAINSAFARTQEQFHIHTSCVAPLVSAVLAKEHGHIGQEWTRLQTPIDGTHYMVRRLDQPGLVDQNIIDLLPEPVKTNPTDIARQTLVVVGATFEGGVDGFYVLNTQASGANRGNGEALLDFACR